MVKSSDKKTTTSNWTLKNISQEVKDRVMEIAKEENMSVSEFVEEALKNTNKKYNSVMDTSKIKKVDDLKPILQKLEQRLIMLESVNWMNLDKHSLLDKVVENTQDVVNKSGEFFSNAYHYAKEKCTSMSKSAPKPKKTTKNKTKKASDSKNKDKKK